MTLRTLRPRVAAASLRTAALPPKTAEPFYSSRAWIALRDRVRREAGGQCQSPGCGRVERRMFVDHIVELRDGGPALDRLNCQLLCGACHSLKTAAAKTSRNTGPRGGIGLREVETPTNHPRSHAEIFFPSENPKRARLGPDRVRRAHDRP